MRELDYAGEKFYLSDQLAEAVLEYAKALAERGTADTVHLRAYDVDGELIELDLLVGPASQIVTHTIATHLDAPDGDDEAVEKLRRDTARLRPSRPVPQPLEEDDLNML